MIIWVAGGRDYTNVLHLRGALRPYAVPGNVLITGAARGADLTAEQIWREDFQLPYIGVPAQWSRQGKAAGHNRNHIIAAGVPIFSTIPDILIYTPGGTGTQNAKDQAVIHAIPLEPVDPL